MIYFTEVAGLSTSTIVKQPVAVNVESWTSLAFEQEEGGGAGRGERERSVHDNVWTTVE